MVHDKLISSNIRSIMERSSWIRKMFEEGAALKAEHGAENICDFTLGNPVMEPPEAVKQTLAELISNPAPGASRYMPNAGLPDVRSKIAQSVSDRTELGFTHENIIMTVGAGGALNVIIKALVDPGDEIMVVAPYFAEYTFYASNHQAIIKVAESDGNFQLDPAAMEKAVNEKTRIALLNSPNNPTGAVYPAKSLQAVGDVLQKASEQFGRPIYLVMDEPYRKLTYDDVVVPDVFASYENVITATSHSKDLNLPGERIGYIAISPNIDGAELLGEAMALSNRILGFVNAPALFQRLSARSQDVSCDMSEYAANRKTLVDGLRSIGYDLTQPDGGFYLFPKSPIEDEVEFVSALRERNILVVPGSGFGRGGHFRIAFCCANEVCERALPGFEEAYKAFS